MSKTCFRASTRCWFHSNFSSIALTPKYSHLWFMNRNHTWRQASRRHGITSRNRLGATSRHEVRSIPMLSEIYIKYTGLMEIWPGWDRHGVYGFLWAQGSYLPFASSRYVLYLESIIAFFNIDNSSVKHILIRKYVISSHRELSELGMTWQYFGQKSNITPKVIGLYRLSTACSIVI